MYGDLAEDVVTSLPLESPSFRRLEGPSDPSSQILKPLSHPQPEQLRAMSHALRNIPPWMGKKSAELAIKTQLTYPI